MILLGFGLGLLAGTLTAGLLIARRIYSDQLEQYQPDIPRWVNQGNRAAGSQYDNIVATIIQASDFELWEADMEDQ